MYRVHARDADGTSTPQLVRGCERETVWSLETVTSPAAGVRCRDAGLKTGFLKLSRKFAARVQRGFKL